ncbi:MAG: SPFH domain-containing protein [Armatimonadota bacterium]|nr:SPFH domain-containing protein [Armatimonadota bacterium]
MALPIGMVLLGMALVIGPWTVEGLNPITQMILTVIGAGVLVASAVLIIIAKLYQRTAANEAFVRTGMGGRSVVLDGGAIVIPVMHKTVPVVLESMKLEVERGGEDALITRDNLRCDIRAEFYIKVQAVKDDILNASRSLGDRSINAAAVRDLVFEKLVSALRSVAATRELAQLHAERDDFATAVSELVREDLKSNGLTLESVTISRLDQTDTSRLNEQNVFDAQGLRKIAEITQQARVERNMYERDAERQITQKNVDTRKEVLDLEKEQAEAEATQQADVAMIRSERRQQAETYDIEQRRIVETKDIDKERQVQEAGVQRDLMVNIAKVQAEKDLIAKQQEQQTADILRNQAIQTADVERERAVEVTQRERQIAVAEAEQRRATAEQEQLLAEAQREQAEQEVITVEEVATADRQKQVQVIAAEQSAEQEKIKEQMEADIVAYKNAKVAEGEQEAATRLAEAIRTKAEAERDAARLAAEGEEAKQMVPVNVNRQQVAVDAQRVHDVDAASVEVLRSELAAKAEYEQISVELEKVLADIAARKDVGVAFAHSVGEALSHADMNLYGEPAMLGTALESFAKAAGVSAWADGLVSTLPEGTIETAASTLSGAFPQLREVLDNVIADHRARGGDVEKAAEAYAEADGGWEAEEPVKENPGSAEKGNAPEDPS